MTGINNKINSLSAAPPTEEVKVCILCESDKSELLFSNFDRGYHLPGTFGITLCTNCRLIRLSPRPAVEHLGFYYPETEYYSYQSAGEAAQRGRMISLRDFIRNSVLDSLGYPVPPLGRWQRFLQPFFIRFFYKPALYSYGQRFPAFVPNGKALDIGCGSGVFLNLLKRHGWQVRGIDFSATAAMRAKTDFDIDVFVGDVENAPFEDAAFDFIYLSHSIEHLPDPLSAMKRVAQLLKPTGQVFVETPNIESFSAKICREYWMPLETPRHLHLFSPATLTTLLRRAGLKVSRLRTTFFAPTLAWEDTYKREEKLGEKVEIRPQLRFAALPRAYFLKARARLGHLFAPENAEFIQCWAGK
jgi:SAM-dependent methyltransferase